MTTPDDFFQVAQHLSQVIKNPNVPPRLVETYRRLGAHVVYYGCYHLARDCAMSNGYAYEGKHDVHNRLIRWYRRSPRTRKTAKALDHLRDIRAKADYETHVSFNVDLDTLIEQARRLARLLRDNAMQDELDL